MRMWAFVEHDVVPTLKAYIDSFLLPPGSRCPRFGPMVQCVVHVREKAWLTAPGLLAHADVTKTIIYIYFQWIQS